MSWRPLPPRRGAGSCWPPPGGRGGSCSPPVPAAARWMAALCYLNILILIPACSRWRHHDFVRFHLNQGLVLLAMIVVFAAMGFVPYCYEFSVSCSLLVEVMSIVGLVTALRRKTDPLPVIRNVTRNFHPF